MNKKHSTAKSSGPSSAQIWGATIAAVVVILALALVVSLMVRKENREAVAEAPPVVAVATPAAPTPPTRVEPERRPVRAEPPPPAAAPLVPVAPPRPPVVDTRPALDLGNIAGTLRVNTTATPRDNRLDLSHTCYRNGTSLPVRWNGAPGRTESYVLIMEEHKDGEAPFVKWVVYNIPKSSPGLPGALPQAALFEGGIRQAQNDHGSLGYTGPCIPRGQVKYKLRLFALDTTITAAGNTKFVDLIPLMNGHIVDAAEYDFIHYLKM